MPAHSRVRCRQRSYMYAGRAGLWSVLLVGATMWKLGESRPACLELRSEVVVDTHDDSRAFPHQTNSTRVSGTLVGEVQHHRRRFDVRTPPLTYRVPKSAVRRVVTLASDSTTLFVLKEHREVEAGLDALIRDQPRERAAALGCARRSAAGTLRRGGWGSSLPQPAGRPLATSWGRTRSGTPP